MEARLLHLSGHRTIYIITLFSVLSIFSTCNPPIPPESPAAPASSYAAKGFDMEDGRWVSWNVLFKKGTSKADRDNALQWIINYISSRRGTVANKTQTRLFYCPCDSLLYNIASNVIDGSGQSVTVPSPPPPPPGGSGDGVQYISNNNAIVDSTVSAVSLKNGVNLNLTAKPVSQNKILAIIDTGLDTTFFTSKINDLIWNEQGATLANFIGGELGDFTDDHPKRHGTAVTALALDALGNSSAYPKLMILKALNRDNRGSTFTVSCAMSYAIQKNATLINASLGYYGIKTAPVDSVFRHYISLCGGASGKGVIPVFAAAGNVKGDHDPDELCAPGTEAHRLTASRSFYPACFSASFTNVITVAGLNDTYHACYYHNWSPQFVTLGVHNVTNCCSYFVPFVNGGYEGTSFATPVASGMVMRLLLNNSSLQNALGQLSQHSQLSPPVVKEGTYFNYPGFTTGPN